MTDDKGEVRRLADHFARATAQLPEKLQVQDIATFLFGVMECYKLSFADKKTVLAIIAGALESMRVEKVEKVEVSNEKLH